MAKKSPLIISEQEYFSNIVSGAMDKRGIVVLPMAFDYLVQLLIYYMNTDNLYTLDENGQRQIETLAEMYLKATNSENQVKKELLKKLGDSSLYISGFFGDSLKRKLVDIDYYANMGEVAYNSLASVTQEDTISRVYKEFSHRFLEFVDLLSYISQKAMVQSEKDLLRLYDVYVQTGSELAKEQLLEQGFVSLPDPKKTSEQ